MEVVMLARASGPFGELNRKQKLSTPKYPREYLLHLVDIGVAIATIEDKPEPPVQYKEKKSMNQEKPGSVSPAAPVSQKKMSKKQKYSQQLQSTQTIK